MNSLTYGALYVAMYTCVFPGNTQRLLRVGRAIAHGANVPRLPSHVRIRGAQVLRRGGELLQGGGAVRCVLFVLEH